VDELSVSGAVAEEVAVEEEEEAAGAKAELQPWKKADWACCDA